MEIHQKEVVNIFISDYKVKIEKSGYNKSSGSDGKSPNRTPEEQSLSRLRTKNNITINRPNPLLQPSVQDRDSTRFNLPMAEQMEQISKNQSNNIGSIQGWKNPIMKPLLLPPTQPSNVIPQGGKYIVVKNPNSPRKSSLCVTRPVPALKHMVSFDLDNEALKIKAGKSEEATPSPDHADAEISNEGNEQHDHDHEQHDNMDIYSKRLENSDKQSAAEDIHTPDDLSNRRSIVIKNNNRARMSSLQRSIGSKQSIELSPSRYKLEIAAAKAEAMVDIATAEKERCKNCRGHTNNEAHHECKLTANFETLSRGGSFGASSQRGSVRFKKCHSLLKLEGLLMTNNPVSSIPINSLPVSSGNVPSTYRRNSFLKAENTKAETTALPSVTQGIKDKGRLDSIHSRSGTAADNSRLQIGGSVRSKQAEPTTGKSIDPEKYKLLARSPSFYQSIIHQRATKEPKSMTTLEFATPKDIKRLYEHDPVSSTIKQKHNRHCSELIEMRGKFNSFLKTVDFQSDFHKDPTKLRAVHNKLTVRS